MGGGGSQLADHYAWVSGCFWLSVGIVTSAGRGAGDLWSLAEGISRLQGIGHQDMVTEGKSSGHPPSQAACIPLAGDKVLQEFQVLVQKVGGRPDVLLIGETLEGKDIQGLMNNFVKELFSATCQPVHPADILKEPCTATCSLGGKQCQLIFFLCRPASLKGKQKELKKLLKELKMFVQRTPCAVVGVIMDPTKGEAEAARNQMLKMLRSVFPKPVRKPGKKGSGGKGGSSMELEDIEVEAEVYVPGGKRDNLAIMKAVCRAKEALNKPGFSWRRFWVRGFLGTAVVIGIISGVGWYLYDQGVINLDTVTGLFFSD